MTIKKKKHDNRHSTNSIVIEKIGRLSNALSCEDNRKSQKLKRQTKKKTNFHLAPSTLYRIGF